MRPRGTNAESYMARSKKIFLNLLALLVVVVGLAAALPFLPLSPLKAEAELSLSRMLGRTVTVNSVKLSILTGPHLTVFGMTAEESPAFGSGAFLQAKEVRADIDVIEYLRNRNLAINALSLESPEINLIKNEHGVWSWTTLGKKAPEQASITAEQHLLSMFSPLNLAKTTLKKITIRNASVKLTDRTGPQPEDTLFKNIELSARLEPAENNNRAIGTLTARSEEQDGADLLKTDLPFELSIDTRAPALSVKGSIGPGPIETRNLRIGDFSIDGEVSGQPIGDLQAAGRLSATDMFINTVNISERVARAIKVNQIGDMTEGTRVANLETDVHLSNGLFTTAGLRIQQLDGLGDATAQSGSFRLESALNVNYSAVITLSADSTSRVKSASSMLGLLVTILETNNQLSVPISIVGDVRHPDVQVDASRIF